MKSRVQSRFGCKTKLSKIHGYELRSAKIIKTNEEGWRRQSCNLLLRIQLKITEFLPKQEQERLLHREPFESEKKKHELTHISIRPWCTSCVKSKAQAEPHKRIKRITEDCDLFHVTLVLKDNAASDGPKVLSKYVKSFCTAIPQLLKRKV